ncbi:hypothetical protein Tco_0333985, partial [Tanacetum coccineum]
MCTSSSTQAVSSDVAELKDMVRALILDRRAMGQLPKGMVVLIGNVEKRGNAPGNPDANVVT